MFITAGAGQMAIWAKAKHARLRKVRPLESSASCLQHFKHLSLQVIGHLR